MLGCAPTYSAELGRLLDRERYDIGSADFAVRTPFGVRSPDVVVDHANPHGRELSTSAPLFIAEVLSPSTAGTDFTEKLEEYTSIDVAADLSHLRPGRAARVGVGAPG